MKSSTISTLNVSFDDDILKFLNNNEKDIRKPISDYKSFIIKSKEKGISTEKIAWKINYSPTVIKEYIRKLKFLGEIK
jgi:ribosome-binding protein aMBF1 (putative translation factor)